jgi:toxin-antitoxin system PIN domain toxin
VIAVDANVLVYAHRGETDLHDAAHEALRQLAEGSEPWALPVFCVTEFFRVVTHRRVFNPPSSIRAADEFISSVRRSPGCRVAAPGPDFLDHLSTVLHRSHARGNLVFHAQITALCREHGIKEVLTNDHDFSRFDGLEPRYL